MLSTYNKYKRETYLSSWRQNQKGSMLSGNVFLFHRDVLFEFHLKFWNTTSIDVPVRSLL